MKQYIHNKNEDILKEPHYAIVEFDSVYIPGDERSRTNPGHGYPAENRQICNYIVFDDKEEWEAEITRMVEGGSEFIAINATPAKIERKVVVSIS